MKKTPKEKIEEFILNQIKKEKDKWAVGMKSDYYDWSNCLDDWRSKDSNVKELYELVQVYKAFLKDMGLQADFRKWVDGKGERKC